MAIDTSLLQSSMGFGIKEVSDVAFYNVGDVSESGGVLTFKNEPLFILDTLKVSNIENTAEQTDAKGGKGNAPLITWDYGREITISLQDAVLSEKTLSLMFEGNVVGSSNVIEISANKYPGVYTVVGKTFARDMDGKDGLFTWYVPKAKVNSEVTLTMEAEGDPTVFDMNLKVLRTTDGTMVKLIRDTISVEDYSAKTAFTNDALEKNTYMVKVVDNEGNAVSGAIVILDDRTQKTNEDGIVYFGRIGVKDKTLTVIKSGYNRVENEEVLDDDLKTITLTEKA